MMLNHLYALSIKVRLRPFYQSKISCETKSLPCSYFTGFCYGGDGRSHFQIYKSSRAIDTVIEGLPIM